MCCVPRQDTGLTQCLFPPPWVLGYSLGISTKRWGNPVMRGEGGWVTLWWTSIPSGVMHLKYSKGCNFRFVLDLNLNNRECIYIEKQKRNKRKFPWSKLVTFRLMPSYFFWEALTTLTQPSARALFFPVIWLNKFVLRCNESLLLYSFKRTDVLAELERSKTVFLQETTHCARHMAWVSTLIFTKVCLGP